MFRKDSWECYVTGTKLKRKNIATILYITCILMVIITVFRPAEMPDRELYLLSLNNLAQDNEIGYNIIEKVSYIYFDKNFYFLLLLMAVLAIPIKIIAIAELSKFIWASMLIYISSKFILQDMIQIRAAVSTGIFLYCTKYKLDGNCIKYFLGMLIAILFHWSALLMVPIWFVNSNKIHPIIYILAIIISFVLGALEIYITDAISFIPIASIQTLYLGYTMTNDIQNEFNLFSIVVLSKVLICILLLFNAKRIKTKNPQYIYAVKVYSISFIIYALCSNLTVAAVRLSEFYQIIEIILIPMILYVFKRRVLGKISIMIISAIYLWFNVFITNYFNV